MSDEKTMGQVIQIDEARIRDHLGEMVRGTVEETLNAILVERFQNSNHMGCPKRPHSVDGRPKMQLNGFMESVV